MLSLKQKFLIWLQEPRNRSRFIAGTIGIFVLVGVVLFSSQIGNLLSLFGGRAAISDEDINRLWEQVELTGGEKRAHAKLITVEKDGRAWLYVAGGIDVSWNYIDSRYQTTMVSSVQRIELDPQTGLAKTGIIAWENMPPMNFGHAEFGFVQSGDFLYVVSGDLHTPPEVEGKVPLLYSTVERLKWSDPNAKWEVFALLSGVNFYPEVQVVGTNIHVIGGIYGNPFPPFPNMKEDDQIKDMLDEGTGLWDELKLDEKPIIGETGIRLPYGVLYSNIKIGATPTPTPVEPGPNPPGDIIIIPTTPTITGLKTVMQRVATFIQSLPAVVKYKDFVQRADAQSTLKVTSPAFGAELQAGEYYTIRWEGDFAPYPLGALYFRENSTADWMLAAGPFNVQNKNTFTWKVGDLSGPNKDHYGPTASSAEIKVCSWIVGKEQFDCIPRQAEMEGSFRFVQEFWTSVTAPPAGQRLPDNNSLVTIAWDYHGINAEVRLEYKLGSSPYQRISEVPASDRIYKWYTPNITGADIPVTIRATIIPPDWRSADYLPGSSLPSGTSEVNYILYDRGGDWIKVTMPSGGEVWKPGSAKTIYWDASLPAEQTVYIYHTLKDTDQPAYIGQTKASSFLWQIPAGIFSEHARIIIKSWVSRDGGPLQEIVGTSDIFSIKSSIELTSVLSEALIDGEFVTTVGEHFIINTRDAGELGNDYEGALVDTWEINKAAKLGHLRFIVIEEVLSYAPDKTPVTTYRVVPVPQGRYGHKAALVKGTFSDTLYVFGGASWAKEIIVSRVALDGLVYKESFKSFWVINDALHPLHDVPIESNYPGFALGAPSYKFKGNIAYRYGGGTNWTGSNGDSTLDSFVFKNSSSGAKEGRAFFGLASYTPGTSDYIATGGLINQLGNQGRYDRYGLVYPYLTTKFYRIPVKSTAEVEAFKEGQWQNDQPYRSSETISGTEVYNIQAFGLDGGVITYHGQTGAFQYTPLFTPDYRDRDNFIAHDPHVPDTTFKDLSPYTTMYVPSSTNNQWRVMTDIGAGDADYFGANDLSLVGVASGMPSRAVYRLGGIHISTIGTKTITDTLRVLGPFGVQGVPNLDKSSLVVQPTQVTADGVAYAVATVTLKDYLGQPVVGMHTKVTTNDSTGKVIITPWQGDEPDEGFEGYLKTPDSGIVTFKLSSAPISSPFTVDVFASWATKPNVPFGTIGPQPLTFTNEGVPIPDQSTISAEPAKVVADDTDKATVTVTLNGMIGGKLSPIKGYYVKITSSRNTNTTVDRITVLNNITNSEGQAKFEVRSSTIGQVTIKGYYGKDQDQLANNPIEIPTSATFEFYVLGPRLTEILPNSSFRGKTLVPIKITGTSTHFDQASSIVKFTPVATGADPTKIFVVSTTVSSVTSISLLVNVANDAALGSWNVTVTTNSEIANKEGDDDFLVIEAIDTTLSTISAVPRFVPADGWAYSLVTITLRSKEYLPLIGWDVAVASNRSGDVITPSLQGVTDTNGQAKFQVRSNVIGQSKITGTVILSNTKLGPAIIEFEDPDQLIAVTLNITVPLQANAYDRQIKLYIREKTTGMEPTVDEIYFTGTDDKIIGLPTIYLHPGATYGAWAKGRYHLARATEFVAGLTDNVTIPITFAVFTPNNSLNGGLLVGDFAGTPTEWMSIFHDNKINVMDFWLPLNNWISAHPIADINSDGKVNTADLSFLINNFGPGAPLP